MASYKYRVEYAHGFAEGSVLAESVDEAKQKARDMYHGLSRDTIDAKGQPAVTRQEVTKVTATLEKE